MADEGYYRPLRPGAQIAVSGLTEWDGTIGCFVLATVTWEESEGVSTVDAITAEPLILTCQHVVRPPGFTPLDSFIHQPKPFGFENVVGSYYAGVQNDSLDAALCTLDPRARSQGPINVGPPQNNMLGGLPGITGIAKISGSASERFFKYGRSTGVTTGTLATGETNNEDRFGLKSEDNNRAFCEKGDSGAPVVNERGELVGILKEQSGLTNTIGIVMHAIRLFERLGALVQQQESSRYQGDRYRNRRFGIQLFRVPAPVIIARG